MIVIKTAAEIELMKEACRISAGALKAGGEAVVPGATTEDVDAAVRDYIRSEGAKATFLGYGGFPKSACVSVNEEVIHGIPSRKRRLKEGDIVSIDVGAFKNGFTGDNAATYAVGQIDGRAQKLLDVTREALRLGIAAAKPGNRVGDIGHAVQAYAEENGCSVVRDFVGHGVGRELHEEPEVPNYGRAGHGARLVPGMTIAIEPMLCLGGYEVEVLDNDWTVVTRDGSLSAHFEHSVLITKDGPLVLTVI
ncbi:MAG: type I methionyl aminopeptidase [Oscillospiraceae bacterium]|nr:type I methionyl aminopeptidase [Oscillospiraceae bacterium]